MSVDNRDGAKFCIECGEKFQQTCLECHKTLAVAAKFCDECGHNLSAEQKPPDYSEPQSYTPEARNLMKRFLVTIVSRS